MCSSDLAFGINKVGLVRRGFSPERLSVLQKAFRLLLASRMNTSQAVERIRALEGDDVKIVADFIDHSQRGIIK